MGDMWQVIEGIEEMEQIRLSFCWIMRNY